MKMQFEKLNKHERLVLTMTYLTNIEKNRDYFFSVEGVVIINGLIDSARTNEELNSIECAFYLLKHKYKLI